MAVLKKEDADFSGYVTKAGIKCSDGRTITPAAFQHMDGKVVPLLYQHGHNDIENVLGHTLLEHREDGVYGYSFVNDTPKGDLARRMVAHGDLTMYSIYANQLVEKSKSVLHGMIREVSLVLSGANTGARIENIAVRHADGEVEDLDDEAVIHSGVELDEVQHAEEDESNDSDSESDSSSGETVKDVLATFNEKQKKVLQFAVGMALESNAAKHSGLDEDGNEITHQEGTNEMTINAFEQGNATGGESSPKRHVISHSDMQTIARDASESVGSLKKAFMGYALQHGINDIETLFPEARELNERPEWNMRRQEWVSKVMDGTKKSPFAKIRTTQADITADEARALGYIKGNFKKEEFFSLTRRSTGPTTVYKKQKFERDDVIDITDFDLIAWVKAEMKVMWLEEVARAILVGDGRPVEDPNNAGQPNPDKIKDPVGAQDGTGIRSIANDNDLYAVKVDLTLEDGDDELLKAAMDEFILVREQYKGSGSPVMFMRQRWLSRMLLLRDADGRRMFRNNSEVASELGVSEIIPVEVMDQYPDIFGIMVNLSDYVVGTDRGGELNFFDDFDIDYNQLKYLYEGRMSGSLVKLRSAIVYRVVAPVVP